MFLIGIIFLLVGFWLAFFNRQIAVHLFGRRAHFHAGDFMYSIVRQNIAITGGAFIFGGLLTLYLA
jgi:hypothetical protein